MIDIAKEIYDTSGRLNESGRVIFQLGKEWAEAERDYRLLLAQEITKLKADGLPATLIADVARGNTADSKFKRDLAESKYKSSLEAQKALQSRLSALQSILRVQSEVG